MMLRTTAVAASAAFVSVASAQFLLIPESTTDRVVALNADGTVANSNFLDVASAASAAGVSSTPIEVLEVGAELWVTDQVADRIWRFSNDGALLGDIGAGDLNNIRGMEVVGNTVYVAQGSNGTTFDEGIVTVDVTTGALTGVFGRAAADISYQDVLLFGNELLVTNSDTGNDGIERFDLAGNYLGNLLSTDGVTGLDFGQQMSVNAAGNLLVGGFSPPSGVYEVQPDGMSLGVVAGLDFGPRAAYELANGEIMWTNGTWVRTDDTIFLEGASFRYITPSSVPAPAGVSLLGALAVIASRRRR